MNSAWFWALEHVFEGHRAGKITKIAGLYDDTQGDIEALISRYWIRLNLNSSVILISSMLTVYSRHQSNGRAMIRARVPPQSHEMGYPLSPPGAF